MSLVKRDDMMVRSYKLHTCQAGQKLDLCYWTFREKICLTCALISIFQRRKYPVRCAVRVDTDAVSAAFILQHCNMKKVQTNAAN